MTLTAIAVTPHAPTPASGASVQFTATGTYSDASTLNLTSAVLWSSSDNTIATVTNGTTGGLAHVVGTSGTCTITASLLGHSDGATFTLAPNQQVAAVISPYSTFTGLAASYCYCAAYPVPSDVGSVEVGLANRDIFDGTNPGAYTMIGVGIGIDDGSGKAYLGGAPLQTFSNVPVAGDGSITYLGPVSFTPAVGLKLLVAWQFPFGSNVAFESGGGAAQIYGFVNATGFGNVTTLPGMVAVDGTSTVIGGNILLRYSSTKTPLVALTDSIGRGIQYQGVPSTFARLVGDRDWAVAVNGVASSTAQQWADPSFWPWTHYPLNGQNVYVALGINDLQGGRTGAQIITDLISCMANARALGAASVGLSTITPYSGFSPGQNTDRNTVNSAVRGSLGQDWTVDEDQIIDPGHTNAVQPAYGGPIHLNTLALGLIAAQVPTSF